MVRLFCLFGIIAVVALFEECSKSNPTNSNTVNLETAGGMRHIPGGTFQMGSSNPNVNAVPVHSVTISSFYIDTTLVTQKDYQMLMGVYSFFFPGNPQQPADLASWFDAVLYCNARSKQDGKDTIYGFTSITGISGNGCSDLGNFSIDFNKNGYRLPTEAEWEYACRAGSTMDYYWGGSYPPTTADAAVINTYAVCSYSLANGPQAVATKLPNGFGLYDMIGNLEEWCNDWNGSYTADAQTNPIGATSGYERILRGGSWNLNPYCSAERDAYGPSGRNYPWGLGFRCVRR